MALDYVNHAAVKKNTDSRQAQLYHNKLQRCTGTSTKSSITYFNAHSQQNHLTWYDCQALICQSFSNALRMCHCKTWHWEPPATLCTRFENSTCSRDLISADCINMLGLGLKTHIANAPGRQWDLLNNCLHKTNQADFTCTKATGTGLTQHDMQA